MAGGPTVPREVLVRSRDDPESWHLCDHSNAVHQGFAARFLFVLRTITARSLVWQQRVRLVMTIHSSPATSTTRKSRVFLWWYHLESDQCSADD
jgi:hypothetical protein